MNKRPHQPFKILWALAGIQQGPRPLPSKSMLTNYTITYFSSCVFAWLDSPSVASLSFLFCDSPSLASFSFFLFSISSRLLALSSILFRHRSAESSFRLLCSAFCSSLNFFFSSFTLKMAKCANIAVISVEISYIQAVNIPLPFSFAD